MNVHLPQELESLVQNRVDSGRYSSAIDVVGDALRLLLDRDEKLENQRLLLDEKIAQGLDSLERGDWLDGDEFFAQLELEEAQLEGRTSPR